MAGVEIKFTVHLHAIDASVHAGKENRADLCYSLRLRQKKWHDWRAYVAKEKQLKKKLAKEEKERLKRAKENAKKRASRDRLKAEEQAAKDAAAAEKAAKGRAGGLAGPQGNPFKGSP